MLTDTHPLSLPPDLIRLGAAPAGKEAAIREAAQLLIAAGCIDPAYADSMIRRETVANTFLGHGVAIPHGMVDDRNLVRRNGIAILQVPDGVVWNDGQTARLVVAIAAQSDAHIAILRRLTRLMQDEARLTALFTTGDPADLVAALSDETASPIPSAADTGDLAESFDWVVDYPTGLHARPAAAWVESARAASGRVRVRYGGESADGKTLVALLQLGLRPGDRITVSTDGPDARAVLNRLRATITGLSAREKADAAAAARKAKAVVQGWTPPAAAGTNGGREMPVVAGIGASPGLTIGPVHVMPKADLTVPDRPAPLLEGGNRLHEALNLTRQQLKALADDTARRLGPAEAGIFAAQAELLNDTDVITLACQLMVEGHGPGWSWNEAVERSAAKLAANPNPVLAGRAADLRDVGRRVLTRIDPDLRGGSIRDLPDTPCILVADDLSPSDTAALDMGRVIGLATAQGGPTSHTAILARTLGLPAMVAGGAVLTGLANGTTAILDGQSGRLYLQPSDADIAAAHGWIEEQRVRKAQQEERRSLPARTRDGHTVEIGANVNRPDQVAMALSQGGEGVGLMRTEFLFLERGDAPSEEEQYQTYRAMLEALDGRPLIVRALDIGGDKQVPHLQLPHEENPFLGVRGARLLLRHPELLEPQLRALYRAAKEAKPGALLIMFPMITTLREVETLRAVCDRIRAELDAPAVPLGIMVEVPAAAIQADVLARHVDFFSIGTNDLTQYALAIDRQHPELAAEADSLHPSVLRLIRLTVEGAKKHGRWVGVCGGIAGDPFGAALLAGLGVRELSMTPRDIPGVKDKLRDSDLAGLRALAQRALDCESSDEVRALEGEAS
ncbi:phosphoenolpyruvate--protein phosphotransferase [Azospirillum sp. TSA6c]|uniref:phosphoenolpyruvate--protein phosphotransferase n=1 Tax=unclassified Azospirillum TaxID=2630922 RepID=UPI000D61A106|nr:phosphoenolpyruvate--protein phosphotransferase [Azospirillum sp. TSA6c]PWC47830.1 PTS fructose transporter subunit IIA [Azospirillum sp. TSA6c]